MFLISAALLLLFLLLLLQQQFVVIYMKWNYITVSSIRISDFCANNLANSQSPIDFWAHNFGKMKFAKLCCCLVLIVVTLLTFCFCSCCCCCCTFLLFIMYTFLRNTCKTVIINLLPSTFCFYLFISFFWKIKNARVYFSVKIVAYLKLLLILNIFC